MRAILALGSGMQIEVVAEGVETDAQRDLLHRSGCRWGQGYLFARPLPADEVIITARRESRQTQSPPDTLTARPPVAGATPASAGWPAAAADRHGLGGAGERRWPPRGRRRATSRPPASRPRRPAAWRPISGGALSSSASTRPSPRRRRSATAGSRLRAWIFVGILIPLDRLDMNAPVSRPFAHRENGALTSPPGPLAARLPGLTVKVHVRAVTQEGAKRGHRPQAHRRRPDRVPERLHL